MKSIDLNCDLGEGMATDEEMIALISSANIACGFHAGNEYIMKTTIELCLQYNVAIGAHPSWPDKENFGRTEMQRSPNELYNYILQQLKNIDAITKKMGAKLHHIKPHGALYNQAAKDKTIAATIAKAVKDFDGALILYGLSGSILNSEAQQLGLQTANEVFADRTYTDEGYLTTRSQPNALIEDAATAANQALQLIQQGTLKTTSGNMISVSVDTICLHGDGKHAVEFCKTIHEQLKNNSIEIKALQKIAF